MRKEPFGVGDYVHVYNRGNKKQAIVKDEHDKQHFLQMLFYFNTEITPPNQFQDLKSNLRFNLKDNTTATKPFTYCSAVSSKYCPT